MSVPEHEAIDAPAPPGYEMVWTPDPAAIDLQAELPERYELARDFGDGLAGPLFGVRDRQEGGRQLWLESVAFKLVPDEQHSLKLQEELAAARRVVSAHVVRVRELGQLSDGRFFVTFDAVAGERLSDKLAREGPLHPRHALEIVRQIALGLASAHEQGVVHGALTPASVWLAGGAPRTDADPHGVAVRLADFGLSRYLASQDGRVPEAANDVEATLEILRQVCPPDASHPLGAEIAALLQGLRPKGGVNAKRLSAEIETLLASSAAAVGTPRRTEAQRPPKWFVPVLALLAVVAAFEGVLVWRGKGDVQASEDTRAQEAAALRRQLDEQRSLAHDLAKQRDEAARERDEKSSQLTSERERNAKLDSDLSGARKELGGVQEAVRTTDEQRQELAQRIELLENEATPTARAARNFDAALAAIENESGEEAKRRIAALESEGLTSPAYVRELATAAAELEAFARSRGAAALDVEALRRADLALQRAEASRSTLNASSGAWIAYGEEGANVRLARAEEAHTKLREALSRARSEAVEIDRAQWEPIAAASGIQDPSAAFTHAERFGCAHLSELAARFASELHAWTQLEGALDVERLSTFRYLGDWNGRLREGRATLPDPALRELELLEWAQRWYDDDPSNDVELDGAKMERGTVGSLRHDWRNELYLQWSLARPTCGYPIRRDTQSLFRTVSPEGTVEWWRETPETVAAEAWRIRRERLSADASTSVGEGTVRIERRGHVFAIPGASVPLLDLRAHGDAVMVAPHPSSFTGSLPESLGVADDDLQLFRRSSEGDPCLVYVQGDVRRWISPEYGLVREESRSQRGWFTRELVFATPER